MSIWLSPQVIAAVYDLVSKSLDQQPLRVNIAQE
jgi:hypothetical protein